MNAEFFHDNVHTICWLINSWQLDECHTELTCVNVYFTSDLRFTYHRYSSIDSTVSSEICSWPRIIDFSWWSTSFPWKGKPLPPTLLSLNMFCSLWLESCDWKGGVINHIRDLDVPCGWLMLVIHFCRLLFYEFVIKWGKGVLKSKHNYGLLILKPFFKLSLKRAKKNRIIQYKMHPNFKKLCKDNTIFITFKANYLRWLSCYLCCYACLN